ncbi:MAG: T9SS type A sorting domain-containing protein [Ginsengibacter sp.]
MKKYFYILIFILAFNFESTAQIRQTFDNEVLSTSLKYYPNPAVSFINFEFGKEYDKSYTLYIYSFIGKKVVELKFTELKMTIALNDFYRGVYIFQFRNKQGTIVESGKFQVVK